MEIKTVAKRWGNSIGFVLPKAIVDARKIKEDDEIIIDIKTRPVLSELFGRFPRRSKSTAQKLKNEVRTGWD